MWADTIRKKEPVVINDYQNDDRIKKGQPEGHVEIRRYLGVPVLRENKIVAVIGVANKETDYNYSDIIQLRLFIDNVWEVIERKMAEKKLEKYAKELENTKH